MSETTEQNSAAEFLGQSPDDAASQPADLKADPAARRAFREQAELDALLRLQSGRLAPPANLAARLARALWQHRVRVGLELAAAAVICLSLAGLWIKAYWGHLDTPKNPMNQVTAQAIPSDFRVTVVGVGTIKDRLLRVTIVPVLSPDGDGIGPQVYLVSHDCAITVDGKPAGFGDLKRRQQITALRLGPDGRTLLAIEIKAGGEPAVENPWFPFGSGDEDRKVPVPPGLMN